MKDLKYLRNEALSKMRKRKAIQSSFLMNLIKITPSEEQAKSYANAYNCGSVLELREGEYFDSLHQKKGEELKIAHKPINWEVEGEIKERPGYCSTRFCLLCARRRTAILIDKYLPHLMEWEKPMFVTLTIKNPDEYNLKKVLNEMKIEFNKIRDLYRKKNKDKIVAVRKLEITYNRNFDDYHPHFHLIVKNYDMSSFIVREWVKRFGDRALREFQEIIPANEGSIKELFKYVTKLVTKFEKKSKPIPSKNLDVIFRHLRGQRTIQNYGFKVKTPEIEDEVISINENGDLVKSFEGKNYIYEEKKDQFFSWWISAKDWIDNESGEFLHSENLNSNVEKYYDKEHVERISKEKMYFKSDYEKERYLKRKKEMKEIMEYHKKREKYNSITNNFDESEQLEILKE